MSKKTAFTEQEFIEWLRGECKRAGSARQFALSHGLATTVLSRVMGGERLPHRGFLKACGFETCYRPIVARPPKE